MKARQRVTNAIYRLRSSLWFTPATFVLLSVILLVLLLEVDSHVDVGGLLHFSASPLEVREIASTIAGAMMSFIAVVFSITILALQLASRQFSPRVLRSFLRDRLTKVALGLFVATFAYALMLIKFLDTSLDTIPDLTVNALFVLAFLCIGVFIAYIDHISQSVRVVTILQSVADETRRAIDRQMSASHDESLPGPPPIGDDAVRAVSAGTRSGVVTTIDAGALVRMARRHGCRIELACGPGDFVRSGGTLARLDSSAEGISDDAVRAAVSLGIERTMQEDVAFGFRQIVDIAERALSPGTNDPTTAVQAIDRLHDLLGRLATRDIPDGWHRDEDGTPRVLVRARTWDEYVALAVDGIRLNAGASLSVHQRLHGMLDELASTCPASRAAALRERLDRLAQGAVHDFDLADDTREATTLDGRGRGGTLSARAGS